MKRKRRKKNLKNLQKMHKYLMLEFNNASLIRWHRGTKDKISDPIGLGNKVERRIETEFVEPITAQQISGMLHVLFGERPKPMNRKTVYERMDYLYEKAGECYIKFDNFTDSDGKFQTEVFQTNKSSWNSWQTTSFMNWNRVYNLLEDEYYTLFLDMVKEVFNHTPETITFVGIAKLLKANDDQRVVEVFEILNANGKTPLYSWIYGEGTQKSEINKNIRTQITVIKGVDTKINLSGSIVVPVNDEDIEKIRNSKGCATLLDGGAVFIKGLKNNINTEGYTRVGDISMEKRQLSIKK
jgi:hypothetical protein